MLLDCVQLEVGVNSRQVVSFCPTILSEKRTTKTSKTSKKQRQRDSLLRPTHGPALRARATLPGRFGKTQDVQERNQCLGMGAFFQSARAKSLAGGRPCVRLETYSAEPRMNRHSLKERFFEVFSVCIIAAGLSGPQKPPLSGSTSCRSGWSLTPTLDCTLLDSSPCHRQIGMLYSLGFAETRCGAIPL
jgi:hypothetical protein